MGREGGKEKERELEKWEIHVGEGRGEGGKTEKS